MSGITRALAVSVALLAVAAGTTPATAEPDAKPLAPNESVNVTDPVPVGFAGWHEVYALQDKLNAAATRILAAGGAGNAGIVASPLARELRVHWKGEVPATVAAAGLGVPVRFLPAAYTQTELAAEARRLTGDPRVIEVAPKADGSGLDVTVDPAVRAPGAERDLLRSATVAVTVTPGRRPQAMFSRQGDVPAFWGGARYRSDIGGCTTGFALRHPAANPEFMLSAGHCADNWKPVTTPGQGGATGMVVAENPCRDIMLIHMQAGVTGSIYMGGPNSTTGVSTGGGAAEADFVGNLVTTSGATSGQHNNISVQAVNVFVAVTGIPCASAGPLTRAGYASAACAAAPGDSGGPVVALGASSVVGRGTITAGNVGSTTCPSPTGTVAGADTVYYAPLLRPAGDPHIGSLQYYGLNLA